MNPSDKYEQIKDIKHLNPVELEAMVLCHEQQIKDLAAQLLKLNKKEKKEWVGLTQDELAMICDSIKTWHDNREEEVGCVNPSEIAAHIEAKLKEKNK